MNHHDQTAVDDAAAMHIGLIRDKTWYGQHWIRDNKRAAIYSRDGYACVYCGITSESAERQGIRMTLDHVHPRELGGTHNVGNLVTACLVCNCAKQSKGLRAFLKYLRGIGIQTAGIAKRVRRQKAKSIFVTSAKGQITKVTPTAEGEIRKRVS